MTPYERATLQLRSYEKLVRLIRINHYTWRAIAFSPASKLYRRWEFTTYGGNHAA